MLKCVQYGGCIKRERRKLAGNASSVTLATDPDDVRTLKGLYGLRRLDIEEIAITVLVTIV